MSNEEQIRDIIVQWANATRRGKKDVVLSSHTADCLIFDVLPPIKYDSAAEYRKSFDQWWPDTVDDSGLFELQDLKIVAGENVAYAHSLIRCGGTAPGGSTFEDTVRLTHCLQNEGDGWKITHSHTSMPISVSKENAG